MNVPNTIWLFMDIRYGHFHKVLPTQRTETRRWTSWVNSNPILSLMSNKSFIYWSKLPTSNFSFVNKTFFYIVLCIHVHSFSHVRKSQPLLDTTHWIWKIYFHFVCYIFKCQLFFVCFYFDYFSILQFVWLWLMVWLWL